MKFAVFRVGPLRFQLQLAEASDPNFPRAESMREHGKTVAALTAATTTAWFAVVKDEIPG